MAKLNATAKATLREAGISQAAWARANWMRDGRWSGDQCGCPDTRCANGFHHLGTDDCSCLPVLIGQYFEWLRGTTGTGSSGSFRCSRSSCTGLSMKAELIRWTDNGYGGFLGYVGTVKPWLYQIWKPHEDGDDWELLSAGGALGCGKVGHGKPDELKERAGELLREFASALGAVFPEPAKPLSVADGMICEWAVDDAVSGGSIDCGRLSRYRVERSDRDGSFYPDPDNRPGQEACDIHLAGTVVALMDGDDKITATVTVRWD